MNQQEKTERIIDYDMYKRRAAHLRDEAMQEAWLQCMLALLSAWRLATRLLQFRRRYMSR